MAGRTRQVKVLKRWKTMLGNGYKFTCEICNRPISDEAELSVDHLIPRSLGGKSHPNNFRPTHAKCNNSRGNKL